MALPTNKTEDKAAATALQSEAQYFGDQDNSLLRSRSWSSLPIYQHLLNKSFNLNSQVSEFLKGRSDCHALTLACGDMQGEYKFLTACAGAKSIDAFDVSEGQREKFLQRKDLDSSVSVNYQIADVNTLTLSESSYDIVYVQQAYHHLEEIEHVAKQINNSLKPNGIFVLVDYIGANFLQRSAKQRKICERLWPLLAGKYRSSVNGEVREKLQIPDPKNLSPFEAIRSEEILDVLHQEFNVEAEFQYAGILFPLLEGFAQNYDQSETDRKLLFHLWKLDRELLESGEVDANFIRAIFSKKS